MLECVYVPAGIVSDDKLGEDWGGIVGLFDMKQAGGFFFFF